jgi:ABC-2 type transport system permease protein
VSAVASVYKWELLKLKAQKRTYLGLGAAMIVPIIFVVALAVQGGAGPNDIPIGRYIRDTGLATPFVVLFFMSIWAFPLIAALVAGDIVASESHNDTLKTILTRSRERGEIFVGKLLAVSTYAIAAVVLMGVMATIAGTIEWGFNPLTSLSGTQVSAGRGLELLAGSLGIYAFALIAIASFGVLVSTVTRNSAASVVGTLMFALLMQVIGVLPGTEAIRPYLLSEQFSAWHGFLRVPADWAPVIRALWVSAIYVAVPAVAAYLVFLRRDVTSTG